MRKTSSLWVSLLIVLTLDAPSLASAASCASRLSRWISPWTLRVDSTDPILSKLEAMWKDRVERETAASATAIASLSFSGKSLPILKSLDDRGHVHLVNFNGLETVYKTFRYRLKPPPDREERWHREELEMLGSEVKILRGVARRPFLDAAEILAVDEVESALLKRYVRGVSFLEIERRGPEFHLTPTELRTLARMYDGFATRLKWLAPDFLIPSPINVFFDLDRRRPVLIDPF